MLAASGDGSGISSARAGFGRRRPACASSRRDGQSRPRCRTRNIEASTAPMINALTLVLAAIVAWLAIGALALVPAGAVASSARSLFAAGAAGRPRDLASSRWSAIGRCRRRAMILPLGLPICHSTCGSTSLSAFFLLLLGAAAAGIRHVLRPVTSAPASGAAPGLVIACAIPRVPRRDGAGADRRRRVSVHGRVGNDGAGVVFPRDDRSHRIPEIRRAGFLYLLIAHIGAIAILLCFGVLQGGSGDYTFDAMRAAWSAGGVAARSLSARACSASAPRPGCCPLHVWLPEAHPAAPSPVSRADERGDAEDRDLRPRCA